MHKPECTACGSPNVAIESGRDVTRVSCRNCDHVFPIMTEAERVAAQRDRLSRRMGSDR